MPACLKCNKSEKARRLREEGGTIGEQHGCEQWVWGAKDVSTGMAYIDVLPQGGKKTFNAQVACEYIQKVVAPGSLLCTDGARCYNVKRPEIRDMELQHCRCSHRTRERVKADQPNVAGEFNVGTQGCVCVCVCVCLCVRVFKKRQTKKKHTTRTHTHTGSRACGII